MGRSIFCSKCKQEKGPGNDSSSYCKPCRTELRKASLKDVKPIVCTERRPRRFGKCPDCPDCGIVKENPKQAYCNSCRSKRSKEWALKTGRVKKNNTGLCPCGAPRAENQPYFCAKCKAEDSRAYREARGHTQEERDRYNAWYEANKDKINERRRNDAVLSLKVQARNATNYALITGFLNKLPCEVCGTMKYLEAHHEDYSKPLEIRWLCRKHHAEHHRNESLTSKET